MPPQPALSILPDGDALYTAYVSRDPRFDGRFFVGVTTTGIYCRPICPAKTPKRDHCTFHPSAAAAEAAGFRPCLRCRPELAPVVIGHHQCTEHEGGSLDACRTQHRLAQLVAAWLDSHPHAECSLEVLAARFSVSSRQLRRQFVGEYGVPPVAYRQTRRMLLAKQLLTSSSLSIADVAMAAGFGSLRRMNSLFLERYGMAPSELRLQLPGPAGAGGAEARQSLRIMLPYKPPYDWGGMLAYLAARAITGVEEVVAGAYRRTVAIQEAEASRAGWVEVANDPQHHALRVTVAESLLPCLPVVLGRLRMLFDCACDPQVVAEALGELAADCPGRRVPGALHGFEAALRAVIGQQVTVGVARTILGRVVQALGAEILTPFENLTRCMPDAAAISQASQDTFGALGVVRQRSACLHALASEYLQDPGILEPRPDVQAQLARLLAIKGVGPWTAQYLAMRALAWPDAWPTGDAGLRAGLGLSKLRPAAEKQQMENIAEAWRPWRSYAVMHLWRLAEEGRTWLPRPS